MNCRTSVKTTDRIPPVAVQRVINIPMPIISVAGEVPTKNPKWLIDFNSETIIHKEKIEIYKNIKLNLSKTIYYIKINYYYYYYIE